MTSRMQRVWPRVSGWLPYVIVIVVAVAAVAPALAVQGIVATRAGGDSPFLLQRVHQMTASMAALDIPARWMPDASYGLGYPFWNYYAPLAYLAAGLVALAGGGAVGAIKVTTLAWFLVAAVGALRLAWRTWDSAPAGVIAAVAYTLAPYHMVNVYVRGDALSELAAYALFPWVLLAIDRAVEHRDGGSVALLAVAFGLLALSHTISAMLFAPVILAYAVWRLVSWHRLTDARRADRGPAPAPGDPVVPAPAASRRTRPDAIPVGEAVPVPRGLAGMPALSVRLAMTLEHRLWPWRRSAGLRAVLAVGAGLALGALLSAWYWAPALAESDAVQLEGNLTGYFDYAGHFRDSALVDLSPAVDYRIDDDQAPWHVGLVQLGLALAGLVAGLVAHRRRGAVAFWLIIALAASLLITSLSRPLWDTVPLLGYAQFPWRLLSVQALALAMLAAPLGAIRFGRGWAVLATVLLLVTAMWRLPVETLGVHDVTRADLAAFEVFSGNIGSTVRAEYLPRGVEPRPYSSLDLIYAREGEPRATAAGGNVDSATLDGRGVTEQTWRIDVSGVSPVEVAFPTLAFPGWSARVEPQSPSGVESIEGEAGGPPQAVGAVAGSGWMTVALPPGSYRVTLALGRSDVRAWAEGLTLIGIVLLVIVLLGGRHPGWRRGLMLVLTVFLASVLLARFLPRSPQQGPRTLDYARAPYPHYNPDGIDYGASRLVGSQLRSGPDMPAQQVEARAGHYVDVELFWENAQPDWAVEAALVAPAEVHYGVPDVHVAADLPQTDPSALRLELPEDVPSGIYFVRLGVSDSSGDTVPPVNADGFDVGTVYLGPLRVEGLPDFRERPAAPVSRMGDIALHAVQAVQDGDLIEVRMYWEADREQVLDYKTSVRLLDADGETIASDDKAPLYGFLPTTAWHAGEQILDRRWLEIPPDTAPGDDYHVEVVMYDALHPDEPLGTGQVRGVRVEGGVRGDGGVPVDESSGGGG